MIYDNIKAKFLTGEYVRVIDFTEADRAEALGAIKNTTGRITNSYRLADFAPIIPKRDAHPR